MKTYIALVQGINVGGKNVLPMRDLVSLLENISSRSVETYIQSGNAVFQSEETDASALSERIRVAIGESHGFEPRIILLTPEEMESAVEANPFPEAESEPKTLHFFFLASAPEHPDFDTLERMKNATERFALEGGVFYLHAPDGVGRSKLAANAEKLLGAPVTARNWRTVGKVLEMAKRCG